MANPFLKHGFGNQYASKVKIKKAEGKDDRGVYRVEYPELKRGAARAKVLKQLNLMLKNKLRDHVLCHKDETLKHKMSTHTKVNIRYLSRDFFSFSVDYNVYCGGPYPEAGRWYFIYNLKEGHPLYLEHQFRDVSQFKNIVINSFLHSVPSSAHKECLHLYTRDELEHKLFHYLLVGGKIIARQDYPHAVKECEYDVGLSCREIRPLLLSHSLLQRYCMMAS